ncbi:MAG: hypothetical protein RLY86_4460 [Pseudomonadota bacterium]|jgi:hypothetical protein
MRRSDLSPEVRQCLVRYPPPYDSHYGVVPAAPPESGVPITEARRALFQAT